MDTALLIRNTSATLILDALCITFGGMSAPNGLLDHLLKGAAVKILLVISDSCNEPSITNNETEVRVTIGTSHDFDAILDVVHGFLSNDQIAHIHRLWSDDDFPRNFNRVGDELIISARE